jgi:hypothetical protein
MRGYLPREWFNKHVAVVFEREGAGGIDAKLISDSEGGVFVEVGYSQDIRRLFMPWSAVRYVELLEEADESRPGPGARAADMPEDIAP